MRRVLVLNHFAVTPGVPGGTRHIELFSRLTDWSYLIVAARTGRQPRDGQLKGYVQVPTVPYRGNGMDRIANWVGYAASAAARTCFGRRPDLVYGSSPHLLSGLVAQALSARFRVPFVLEVRDLWPQVLLDMDQLRESSATYRSLRFLEEWLYSRADRIVVLAEGTRDHLIGRGIDSAKIVVIPNAADPRDFEVACTRQEARAKLNFHRSTFVYAGAHGPANGLDLLLRAAKAVSDTDAEIILVGDGVAKQSLRDLADQMNLTNVRFLDPIPKQGIPQLLAAADAGLHVLADVPLFRYGISPNKVFDYMSAGLPLISNAPGEIGDLVYRAGAGLVVEPGGLAEGIRQFMCMSPADRLAMGAAGRRFMEDHHSRTQMALRLQLLLDEVVAK